MTWPPEGLEVDYDADEVAVCPDHLRFVPCRSCPPGQERYSTDPEDVRRTREHQSGAATCPCARDDFDRTYFDRSICPEPCAAMHQRCLDCGRAVDGCPFEDDLGGDQAAAMGRDHRA